MTAKDQIVSLWRKGYDTHSIAREVSKETCLRYTEPEVHKIITDEREARLRTTTLKAIQGGASNAR